jgi:BASS family bile acid:Na+ symporter
MLQFLTNIAVPACLFFLMLIAGTEISAGDFTRLSRNIRAIVLGSLGQLLALPPLAILINALASPPPPVIAGTLLLSVCPNGGISNYYCYLARSNVLLSATITALGTALSLLTIPVWLQFLPTLPNSGGIVAVPTKVILGQLVALLVVPMAIGMFLRRVFPRQIEASAKSLRLISLLVVALILASAIWTVADQLSVLFASIALSATLFILSAMLLGWIMGYGLGPRERPVLVIEGGIRNVGVALILGGAVLSKESFGIFASFLTGYFIVETAIMLVYARRQAEKIGHERLVSPAPV